MQTLLIVIHIMVGLFMILFVLLQAGKSGGGIGFGGGGGSQTVFGATGAGNFLTKLTTGCAITFFITSLSLAYLSSEKAARSVINDVPATTTPGVAPDTAPAAPKADSPETKPSDPAKPSQ